MSRTTIFKYVTPWRFRREQAERQRVATLRERDGDSCRRCRRLMRFDLQPGHDKGPRVEPIDPGAMVEERDLANLCLTHRRCNAAGADNTVEVQERVRMKGEAELFTKSRTRRRA